MKGIQKYERIIWKKGGGGTGTFSFHGPYYLGARNRLLAHWPEHIITCFHCMKYLVVLIIIGAEKSKRIKLQHNSF